MSSQLPALLVSIVVSGATAFLVGRATARDATPSDAGAASLKEALADVERSREEIRALVAQRPPLAAAPASAPEPRAPRSAATPPHPAAPPPTEPAAATRPAPPPGGAAAMLPPANLARAKDLHGWDRDEEVRRRWFLVSESEVLATFGTPQQVAGWENGERWEYSNEDWNLSLCFLRGRLVAVYSTDKRR